MGRELGPAPRGGETGTAGGDAAARAGRLAVGLAALALACVGARGARADVALLGAPTTESGTLQAHTWTHPVPPGGERRYLVVGVSVAQEGGRAPQVESLTFARLPLVFLGAETHDGHARAELWGLPDPPEGDQPISVRLTGPGGFVAGALVFAGVAASPRPELRGARGTSAAALLPVAGPPGGRVVGVYAADGEVPAAHGAGQTGHWSLRAKVLGAAASAPSGPTSALGWLGPGQAWAAAAVALAAAPGRGGDDDAGAGTGGGDAGGHAGGGGGGSGGAPGGGADAGGAAAGAPLEYDVGCACALGGRRRGEGPPGPLLLLVGLAAAGVAARGRRRR